MFCGQIWCYAIIRLDVEPIPTLHSIAHCNSIGASRISGRSFSIYPILKTSAFPFRSQYSSHCANNRTQPSSFSMLPRVSGKYILRLCSTTAGLPQDSGGFETLPNQASFASLIVEGFRCCTPFCGQIVKG